MTIELIEGTLDTASVSKIVSEVLRWMTFDPDVIEHVRATTPTWRDWIGLLDGEPVGVGGCGVSAGMEESSAVSATLCVVPAARHRGVGGTLYRRVSEYARELGREQLELFSFSDDPDCDGFAARHGFTIVMRARGLRLQLEDCPRPEVPPHCGSDDHDARRAAGSRLRSLGDRRRGAAGHPLRQRRATAAWNLRAVRSPAARRAAVHPRGDLRRPRRRTGRWLREARLDRPSSAGIADHDMLAVRRAWRGRGIAQSLKAAQIAWALDNGLIELRTGNEERNTAARAVNAHFPYTPMPDGLAFRGPCAAVE